METRNASKLNWKHVVCCALLLVIFVTTIGIHISAKGISDDRIAEQSDVVPLKSNFVTQVLYRSSYFQNEVLVAGPKEEVTVVQREIDSYITKYADELKFFSKTFGVDYDEVVEELRDRYDENNEKGFESTNIGYLMDKEGNLKTFDTDEYGMVEYFYDYVEKNPKKVNNNRVAYSQGAEYVENLIIYYTTHVYTNVDTYTALSIGAAESGYYKVKYMLRANNVFGGMNSKGLIKYKNIEYGVLSYIRILSRSYYGKGLTTIEAIGKKYCPTRDSNGYKIASPHWIKLVKTAMNKYKSYELNISIEDLISVE